MYKFTATLIRVESNGYPTKTLQVVEAFGGAEDTPPIGTRGWLPSLQEKWEDGAWSLNPAVTIDGLTGEINIYK